MRVTSFAIRLPALLRLVSKATYYRDKIDLLKSKRGLQFLSHDLLSDSQRFSVLRLPSNCRPHSLLIRSLLSLQYVSFDTYALLSIVGKIQDCPHRFPSCVSSCVAVGCVWGGGA